MNVFLEDLDAKLSWQFGADDVDRLPKFPELETRAAKATRCKKGEKFCK